jgi:hypothetical protein
MSTFAPWPEPATKVLHPEIAFQRLAVEILYAPKPTITKKLNSSPLNREKQPDISFGFCFQNL